MDRNEFEKWTDAFRAHFPDSGDWFLQQSAETQSLWFDILKEHDFDVANSALRNVYRNGSMSRWDRERIPVLIDKEASEITFRRKQRRDQSRRARQPRGGSVASGIHKTMATAGLSNVFRELLEAKRDGMSIEDQQSLIAERIPTDPEEGPRYSCPQCRDTGFVTRSPNGRDYAFACSCELGDKRTQGFKDRGRPIGQIQTAGLSF